MKTPTITQNMYAMTHQAKFGKVPLTAAMRDATKVMSHASYSRVWSAVVYRGEYSKKHECRHTYAIDNVASAKGSPTM